jgi:hypothetical protein
MLRKSFPAKALWLTAGLVALSGVMVGSIALDVKKPGGATLTGPTKIPSSGFFYLM